MASGLFPSLANTKSLKIDLFFFFFKFQELSTEMVICVPGFLAIHFVLITLLASFN
jgi:hypothetical protein